MSFGTSLTTPVHNGTVALTPQNPSWAQCSPSLLVALSWLLEPEIQEPSWFSPFPQPPCNPWAEADESMCTICFISKIIAYSFTWSDVITSYFLPSRITVYLPIQPPQSIKGSLTMLTEEHHAHVFLFWWWRWGRGQWGYLRHTSLHSEPQTYWDLVLVKALTFPFPVNILCPTPSTILFTFLHVLASS